MLEELSLAVPHGERGVTLLRCMEKALQRIQKVEEIETTRVTFEEMIQRTGLPVAPFLSFFDKAAERLKDEHGVFWTVVYPAFEKAVSETKDKVELQKWPFKIIKATKIGETARITLEVEGGKFVPMSMDIKDIYSQQRFRERFTVATGKYLDRIKNRAFESLLSGLFIDDIPDTGTSPREMVQDALDSLLFKVIEGDSEEETEESLKTRGYTKLEGVLKFRLNKLKNEYELKSLKPTVLAQCLQDLGAEQVRRGVWKYAKPV